MIEIDKGLLIDKKNAYFSITNGVAITVRPEYIDSQFGETNNFYIWAYHVRIENKSDQIIQLISRYWKIIDENGVIEEITGEGVIGEKPILAPNANFQYSSGVHLKNTSGIMYGHYKMKNLDDTIFEVKIPAFSLDVPSMKTSIN